MRSSELHILLVDDNEVNRRVLGHMLKRLGHDVTMAASGQEAIDQCENGTFDFIFMDMMMPGINGLEATRTIRNAEEGRRRTPIVAVTANVERHDEKACAEAGMDAFMTKPFTLDQVRACLDRFSQSRFSNPESEGLNPAILNAFIQTMGADDLAFVQDILGDLLSEANRNRAIIQDALDNGDAATVARASHSLKSAASVVGAEQLADTCHRFERSARDGKLDDVRMSLSMFDGALNLVRSDIEAFKAQHESPVR